MYPQQLIEGFNKRLQYVEDLFSSIRLPTVWNFELPVILNNASWFRTSVFSTVAAGTAYALTGTAALLNFGTTDPEIIITTPGKYQLFARVRIDYNGATFAANRTVTIKIRRTNNTAADIVSAAFKTEIITTQSHTAMVLMLPITIYETDNIDDNLELFGSVSTLPSAGSIDAVEAELVATRIV